MRYSFLFLQLLLLFFIIANTINPAIAATKTSLVTIYTGPKTGTYYAFGRDIAAHLAQDNFNINFRSSEGSVDNIKRLNNSRNSGLFLGIVQSDVVGFLNRSQSAASQQIINKLRVVAPFYQEEVHVLARKNIREFKDLQGKKIAVGEEGSGHMLTAVNLLALEQITPAEMKKIPPAASVAAVLEGSLDAAIIVGGKPMRLFKNIEDLSKPENKKFALLLQDVHFVPLNSTKFYAEYEPTELGSNDYSFMQSTISTIAVQALLVSYSADTAKKTSSSAEQKRCAILQDFVSSLGKKLPFLQQNAHPKWKEVNLNYQTTSIWRKDECLKP